MCNSHQSLAVKDIWDLEILNINITLVLDKCKDLAKFARRSEHNKNDLKKECKLKNISFIMPVLGVT